MKYLIATLSDTQFELISVEDYSTRFIVDQQHPKFESVKSNIGRIANLTGTRFNFCKDYGNDYAKFNGTSSTPTPINTIKKPVQVNLVQLDDLDIDPDQFSPLLTGTIFDKFVSQDGGFLPGANIMAAGAPGVGKTTVLLDLLANLQAAGRKVLFISAEMNQVDMARYLKRFPNWGKVPILFLADYVDQNPAAVIEQTLKSGWDLVLTDSYTEVNDTVKEECNMSRGKTEKWFLDLMSDHNKGLNDSKTYTTFVTILQLSKGGNFVGSNKLKHCTTAMMHLDWDGQENTGRRYMQFSKNRLGQVGKKLYYSLDNGVQFDEARYARDLFNDLLVNEERTRLATEDNAFDKLFGFKTTDTDVAEELINELATIESSEYYAVED